MSTVDSNSGARDITIPAADRDADGFISIWNIASATCDGDTIATREFAAQLLCFLCKKKADFIVTSSTNAEYLQSWFERDSKLLYDWKPDSEFVDIVSQHAEVPADVFLMFLKNKGFNPASKYTATRNDRVTWFQEMWCVG